MTKDIYLKLRAEVEKKFTDESERIRNIKPPQTSEELWSRYMYVVCNSGMAWKVAKDIPERIRNARDAGQPATSVFRHNGKAAAIDAFWDIKDQNFANFSKLNLDDKCAAIKWCEGLKWIGRKTARHLERNLGVDCAKNDRWLERVAANASETVDAMCQRLAGETGDPIGVVDYIIWRACEDRLHDPTAENRHT